MKYTVLLLTILISAIPASAQSQQSPAVILQQTTYSVLEDNEAVCTGFTIFDSATKKVELLTAGHCTEDIEPKTVFDAENHFTSQKYRLKFIRADFHWPSIDYSLFSFVGQAPKEFLTATRTVPQVGSPVYVEEGPDSLNPFFAAGVYSGRAGCADSSNGPCEITGMYAIQVPAAGGASGSPVVDSFGRVWGILVGGRDSVPGVAYVVLVPKV